MLSASAPLEIFEEIDSTNLEARRRAERGDTGPIWLLARVQSAGRGRRGRTWTSIRGNLMATYLGATGASLSTIALAGFAAGVAIAEVIDDLAGPGRARLKWPNDILLDGGKAAGILLDSGQIGPSEHWFALGFGVNLIGRPNDPAQATSALASALPAGVRAPGPEDFLARVRPRLERWSARLLDEGFEPLRAAWLARAHGLGGAAVAHVGTRQISGRARGLSRTGELELETDDGVRLVSAGDVYFASPES